MLRMGIYPALLLEVLYIGRGGGGGSGTSSGNSRSTWAYSTFNNTYFYSTGASYSYTESNFPSLSIHA
jgi:hypothetical protein